MNICRRCGEIKLTECTTVKNGVLLNISACDYCGLKQTTKEQRVKNYNRALGLIN